MYIVSELFAVILGFLMSTLLLIGSVWFEKSTDPESNYSCLFVKGVRSFAFSGLFYCGLIFIYIFVQGIFSPELGVGTLQYRIAGLLLSLIFGIYLIIGTTFTAPNWKTFVCAIGTLTFFIIWFIPGPELRNIEEPLSYFTGLFAFWLFQAIILGLAAFLENKELIKPPRDFWNITAQFKRITGRKVMGLFWGLFLIELILRFYGYSIFFVK
jgi:hypothetical protein